MEQDFDVEQFIEQYIKNIRQMQLLTDDQIKQLMYLKIEAYPEYFEIISEVSSKIDNKKLLKQILPTNPQSQVNARKIA